MSRQWYQTLRLLYGQPSVTLPGVQQRDCSFRFCQAVWQNIQPLGLQVTYATDSGINTFCRKTLALPFLPADAIVDAVQQLKADAGNDCLLYTSDAADE